MRRTLFEDVHEDFRASFRTFLDREVTGEEGRYGEWERAGIMPREVFALAGRGGLLGMAVPERHGGAGAEDFRFNLIVGEETQRAGVGSFGLGITLHNDICLPYFLSSCDALERGMESFERGRSLEKLGQHGQDTAELSFSDVRVPVENLLGEEGEGFRYL